MSLRRKIGLLICILSAVLCAAIGSLPRSSILPLGPLIGRPNAITIEVHQRLAIVLWVYATAWLILGWLTFSRPKTLLAPFAELRSERHGLKVGTLEDWWSVLVLTLVGAAIRGVHLQTPMAYDEAYTFLNYARKSFIEGIADYDSTNNHLLNTWIMHWLYRFGGPQEPVLRLGVFTAGVLLIPTCFAWALTWTERSAALWAAALVAIAPALITYSYDARGYAYVALAAIGFDMACRKMCQGTSFPRHWQIVALLTAIFGLWAMPIMLYAILASCGVSLIRLYRNGTFRLRIAIGLLAQAALVVFFVFVLYSPAFIYRGLMFLRDPIMQPTMSGNYFLSAAGSWRGAWEWWTAGFIPSWIWAICLVSGCVVWKFPRANAWEWFLPFLVVTAINYVKLSSPPPRIYLFLLPWIALAVAHGFLSMGNWIWNHCFFNRNKRSEQETLSHSKSLLPSDFGGFWKFGITAGVLIPGSFVAVSSPVIIHPEERFDFLDVPAAVDALHHDLAKQTGTSARVLSPLPIDYPTRFYLERGKSSIPMNGQPPTGESIYIFALDPLTIRDTLQRAPIELADPRLANAVWVPVDIPGRRAHPHNISLYRTQAVWAEESDF